MPTPQIRLKKSAVTGKAPELGDLSLGELAINYYDGSLYTKQDTGGVGIATTITNLTPWQETYGGGSLSYTGDINVTGNLTGGTLRADNFTTENAFAIVGSDNNLIQNTTLSVDPASNYLGINQTSPEVTLHMTGEGAQTAQIRMEQYNDSADAPDLRTRRYRGTIASPSAVQAGDYLYRSNHEYYNGTSLLVGGAFAFDNTNNANRTQFSVAVDVDGTGANPQGNNGQFKIDGNDNGAITFNNAYKFPTNDGSANQVLKTDGNGQLSFSDAVSAASTANINADSLVVTGISTIGNMKVGTGNTDVIVEGDMRVTGILSVGQGTITLDPANDIVKIGTSQFKRQTNGNLKLTDTDDNLVKLEVDSVITAGPGITTSNSTNRVGIDSFQASTFQSAIYNVQAVQGVDVDLTTISLMHNGSQTYQTEYATIRTGGQIATYSSEYESGVIQIYAHPVSSTSTTFKVDRTLIGTGAAGITSTSTTSTAQTSVDTFAKATYKSVMYEVQITRGISVHTTQLHLVHNGTTVSMNEFSVLKTGPSLASFDADISGDNVRLLATPSNSNTTVFDVRRTFHEQ